MKIFNFNFKNLRKKKSTPIDRSNEYKEEIEKLKDLYKKVFELYYSDNCQCSYPRFQQLVGIHSIQPEYSFKCYDTELLIDYSKQFFRIEKSSLKDENANEIWTCKKCKSTYEFGWSDFSIHLERQKLELKELKAEIIGKNSHLPIPLFLGVRGYKIPDNSKIVKANFEKFEKYLMEQ